MTYLLPLIVALHASLSVAEDASLGNFHAPGRAERMFHKRAPVDHGTFKVDCKGSESACNNACYYIRCQARNVANPDRIVYIGPNGNNGEDSRNRINSGCNFNNPSSGSVCANFPFSQKFIPDPTIGPSDNWQCDEWPPALAQQDLFGAPNRLANSLRCMPGAENGSLGGKLGNFIRSKAMNRDDFFRVDFLSNIGTADQSKVTFCLNPLRCGNDGYQFGMTEKPVGGGKISAPYNVDGDDNHYALQNTVYKDLFQCGVKFTRDGDKNIKDVELTNWENKDITGGTTSCTLNNNGDKCTLKGLANDLDVKRTGAFGSKLEFEYAPGLPNVEINNFKWDSETSGNGRGPWTDPASDPNRKPLRFCKVVDGSTANTQVVECWFPCYRNSDGQ